MENRIRKDVSTAARQANFPEGRDEEGVRRVLEHYEQQSDQEAVAEDEAAYESPTHTAMEIPVELVPKVREVLAKRRAGYPALVWGPRLR